MGYKMKELKQLEDMIDINSKSKMVVVAAEEKNILEAAVEVNEKGLISPVLVGDETLIIEISKENNLNIENIKIIDCSNFEECVEKSIKLIKTGEGDFLVKGLVDTSILLKGVLSKDADLKTGKKLSHVMVYEIPLYHKLLMTTDGGMVTYPDVETKMDLINNAFNVAQKLGYEEMKVASLAAKEKVNSKMKATIDGQDLKEKYLNGEFPKGVIVEGPISMDLAVSEKAAEIKDYKSEVAGDSDLLLFHNIEMGNGIGKAITYFGQGIGAGVVMGAKVPIVLVSRSDDFKSKYYSILLGSIISKK